MPLEPCVVGLAGLTGTGKSTAISCLERTTGARSVYLGEVVLSRVEEAGLRPGPESEKQVRAELAAVHGPLFALKLRGADISSLIASGSPVLVDAVLRPEERDELRSIATGVATHVIALRSTFASRRDRLVKRANRPFDEEAIRARDAYELGTLKLGDVVDNAECIIDNDGTIYELENALAGFVSRHQV